MGEVLNARETYAELSKNERQSPARAQEMLRWAISTQDGVILLQVIEEVQRLNPDCTGLRPARRRLQENQAEVKIRLQKLARLKDGPKLAATLDRARQMGIPCSDLGWAESALRDLEEPTQGGATMVIMLRAVPDGKVSCTLTTGAEVAVLDMPAETLRASALQLQSLLAKRFDV